MKLLGSTLFQASGLCVSTRFFFSVLPALSLGVPILYRNFCQLACVDARLHDFFEQRWKKDAFSFQERMRFLTTPQSEGDGVLQDQREMLWRIRRHMDPTISSSRIDWRRSLRTSLVECPSSFVGPST